MSYAATHAHPHKLVVLVSVPRSLSTACLRAMGQRDDFAILNEPGIRLLEEKYLNSEQLDSVFPMHNAEGLRARLYIKLQDMLATGNVCVKEMSAAAEEYIFANDSVLHDPNCYVVFIIRNPHASCLSSYKKLHALMPDPAELAQLDVLSETIMSYAKVYALYQRIKASAHHVPIVVNAEDVASHPEAIWQHICTYIDVPYDANMLHWEACGADFSPQDVLGDAKDKTVSAHWHAEALNSAGFHTLPTYAVDEHGKPTFEEIADESTRARWRSWYEASLPYYKLLTQVAVRP